MSTTLHERPPQRPAEQHLASHGSTRRPSALDRLALRAGLLLITYGRRRYATPRDLAKAERARHRLEVAYRHGQNERARTARESDWTRTRWALQRHA